MKILFVNKFFFIKGGAETVYFQERDAMLQAGYQVVDFSMQHAENKPSPWEEFFVHNVDYHDSHGLMSKIKAGVDFIYNAEACAKRAEAAALRAESYAPTGGQVLSVNSKGGAVQLNAQDVGAVPLPVQPLPGEISRRPRRS